MKKWVLSLVFSCSLCLATKLRAQSHEAQQLLLDVEKLAQLKNILADLKKGYEIVSSGYGRIKDISEGSFSLHQAFLDGLLQVSPVVRNYKRVGDIISTQVRLVSEYKRAYRQFRQSGTFSEEELTYVSQVYSNLFNGSVKNLEALARVITSGQIRMSDDERLSAIDAVWKEVEDSYTFLKHFNNNTKVLALQRMKEQHDVATSKKLHGLK